MRYEKKLWLTPSESNIIAKYLTEEPKDESECLGEDDTITNTVVFDNGIEMDIKCCGVQFIEGESNLAWTEAVLFDGGAEVCCSEPSDEYLGKWELEYNGDKFIVTIIAIKQIVVTDIQWDAPMSANLPKKIVIDIDKSNESLLEDIKESAENLSNFLSDTYEYCHAGFNAKFR